MNGAPGELLRCLSMRLNVGILRFAQNDKRGTEDSQKFLWGDGEG